MGTPNLGWCLWDPTAPPAQGAGGGFGTPVLPHTHSWQAKTKGLQSGVDIGVKYSEKQQRNFDEAKMKAGQCVIGLQVGCPTGSHGWVAGQRVPRSMKFSALSQFQVLLEGPEVPQVSLGSAIILVLDGWEPEMG